MNVSQNEPEGRQPAVGRSPQAAGAVAWVSLLEPQQETDTLPEQEDPPSVWILLPAQEHLNGSLSVIINIPKNAQRKQKQNASVIIPGRCCLWGSVTFGMNIQVKRKRSGDPRDSPLGSGSHVDAECVRPLVGSGSATSSGLALPALPEGRNTQSSKAALLTRTGWGVNTMENNFH